MKGVINLNKKTIVMLLNQRFLPDIRVEQEYCALVSAGYRVIVVADCKGIDNKDYEIIRVERLNNYLVRLLSNFRMQSKSIMKELVEKIDRLGVEKVDFIHVHDLKWAYLGFDLKQYYNCKIVIDLHENYPAYIDDIKKQKSSFKKHISNFGLSYNVLLKYEKETLKKCDAFIAVVKEALDRFENENFHHKGIVVSNTKDTDKYVFTEVPTIEDELRVTYVGTIQKLRGIETAMKGMQYLNGSFKLNIVGVKKAERYSKSLFDLKESLCLNNVNLVEWIENQTEVNNIIKNSHICIVPHDDSELTQTTIPHKLFMYMCIGRPVLVSDVKPLKRIVSETNCGLVFKSNDSHDFAQKLIEMNDQRKLEKWGINSRTGAEQKFTWNYDKEKLIALYNNFDVKDRTQN